MREQLHLERSSSGAVWFYKPLPLEIGMHSHTELEFNLVLRGTARYLFSDTRFDLRPGTLVWMFPSQEHVLVDRSPDFQMWIAVFRPGLVRRVSTGQQTSILRRSDP